jgi:hypothetical protein
MMILNNEEISAVLSMENCLRFLENAYKDQAQGTAINRPRSDMYLPATTSGGVYCFKTMEDALSQEKVMALHLNSDVIQWEERGGRIIKDKIPAAPGNKWVGLILLFSGGKRRTPGNLSGWIHSRTASRSEQRVGGSIPGAGGCSRSRGTWFGVAGACACESHVCGRAY